MIQPHEFCLRQAKILLDLPFRHQTFFQVATEAEFVSDVA
jgi:hypothetical protein